MIVIMTFANGISLDCPDMINLGFGLNINNYQPTIWTALQVDCCTAEGVTCVADRVTQINWDNLGIDGNINGTALPSSLISLFAWNNGISGNLHFGFPPGMTEIGLWSNYFTGTIPELPNGLLLFDVSWNQLTGNLPLLPSGLQELHLHGNQLFGDLSTIPPTLRDLTIGWSPNGWGNLFYGSLTLSQPSVVQINFNLISDINILDTSLLTTCDLSNNPLFGNPQLIFLATCLQNELFNASTLPKTITTKGILEKTTFSSTKLTTAESFTTKESFATTYLRTTMEPPTTELSATQSSARVVRSTPVLQSTNLSPKVMETTMSTVSLTFFELPLMIIRITSWMVFRLFVDLMLLVTIFRKTPFLRELRKIVKKNRKGMNNISA